MGKYCSGMEKHVRVLKNVLLSDEPKLQTVWHKTSKPPLKSEDEDFTSIKEGLQKRKNN